ncbi:MAG: hypothetical protein AAB706_03560 [Patescibacteria group bacterium]
MRKQTGKIGSNGYQKKHRYHFWSSVWFLLFFMALAVIFGKQEIISPCPDDGCAVHTVFAKEAPSIQTVRERVILAGIRAWGTRNAEAIEKLVFKESNFNYLSINPASGACGLFQAYPCRKMKCDLLDVDCQITWGIGYITKRYGNANKALQFHVIHGWY